MTYQEALNYLDNIQIDMKSIESVCETSSFIETCKNALEKQIPKKPQYVQYDGNQEIGNYHCTTCKRIIELEPIDHNEKVFCLHCGQALDWSDE